MQVGTTIDGKYKVLALVGAGAMGSVYKAEQLALGRIVALKVLNDQLVDETHFRRFQNEATSLKRLSHRNIVAVHAFEVIDGRPVMVLEYLEGQALSDLIDASGGIPSDDCWSIFSQILDALEHAHHRSLIHRDLKPSNVMICRENDQTVVKLVDFGLAKLMDVQGQKFTRTGAIAGTPAYMSPEQCAGQSPTTRSDLYAVGCTLYAAIHGEPPFDAENFFDVFFKHLNEEPPDLKFPSGEPVSPALRAVVRKALAKDPEQRFSSAGEFAAALEQAKQAPNVVPKVASITVSKKTFEQASSKHKKIALIVLAFAVVSMGAFGAVKWSEHARSSAVQKAKALLNSARDCYVAAKTAQTQKFAYKKTMEAFNLLDSQGIPTTEAAPELRALVRATKSGLKNFKDPKADVSDATAMYLEILKRFEGFGNAHELLPLYSDISALMVQDSLSRTERMTPELTAAEDLAYKAIKVGRRLSDYRSEYAQAGTTLMRLAKIEYDEAHASDTEAKMLARMAHSSKLAVDSISAFYRCNLKNNKDAYLSQAYFRLAMADQAQGKFANAENLADEVLKFKFDENSKEDCALRCERMLQFAQMYARQDNWGKVEELLREVYTRWKKSPDVLANPISMLEYYIKAEEHLGRKAHATALSAQKEALESELQKQISDDAD